MATSEHYTAEHVNSKGKDRALDAESSTLSIDHSTPPDLCVICLDPISAKAIALPCKHDQFDFPCLGIWIQQSYICPLCKSDVRAIEYETESQTNRAKTFYLPSKESNERPALDRARRLSRHHPYSRRTRPSRIRQEWGERVSAHDDKERQALEFRKQVYRRKTPSCYVGANRISRYRNITPASFTTNLTLASRAKMFIRRELQVFNFLNSCSSSVHVDRRAENAEFLLEYVVGILKSIDLKSSTGQAEELLKDFLGRENAKLFLHEVEAWLRSPYERLADWDRHVQYDNAADVDPRSRIR